MSRSVEVYFKNENDAESARSSLQTAKVNNLFIDEMPESNETMMYIPFFPTNTSASGTPGSVGPVGAGAPLVLDDNKEDDHQGRLTHLLQFDVNEEDYDHALSILKQHECYNIKS